MARPKKIKDTEIIVNGEGSNYELPQVESESRNIIHLISQEFGGDMNILRDKINEIIKHLNA